MNWKDKRVAILGWGVDTEDVVPWLLEQGADITVFDKKNEVGSIDYDGKLEWVLGKEEFGDLSRFDAIVRNPAVYRYRKEIVEAEKAGVEITSKIKIFFEVCPAKIIGVTGTKGKGTTSTLIHEILKAGGKDVYIGGNIGEKVFGFLPKLTAESWVVLELSSFQLIDLHRSPHIAVVLMTTVDHLDWHSSVEEYVNAKFPISNFQFPSDFSIFNDQYPNSVKIGMMGKGQKIPVRSSDWTEPMRMRGEHNRENVAAAMAVGRIVGIQDDKIQRIVREFKGLEHRLEEVATVDGVTYYDDSFSTVPVTAIAAIKAFSEPLIIILGGSDKGSDFTELGEEIAAGKNIKAVILIGLMTEQIEAAIKEAGAKVNLVKGLKNMPEIVRKAKELAEPGDVVVLSPAAASFDMFKNYKDRGNQFKAAVRSADV